MDSMIIIIAIVASFVGATIVYFLFPRKIETIVEKEIDETELISTRNILKESEQKIIEQENKLKELNENLSLYTCQVEILKEKLLASNSNQTFSEDTLVLEAKIQKLKKDISDYEEKLKDAEDDIEDYEKKFKKKKEEINEVSEKLSNLEREYKSTKDALYKKNEVLEETKKDLCAKIEAVDVINHILGATASNEENVKEHDLSISRIEKFVEDKILVDLKGYKEILDTELSDFKEKIWQWGNIQRKNWIAGKKTVAFVGEFSAGKTSIINRILSQDSSETSLLPVSSKATTAIPTYISHALAKRIEFTSPNGQLKGISPNVFEKIKKDTLEQVRVSSAIQYFVVSYPNNNLKGLSILDTPGFNSNDKEDAERTAYVIKETDILFWVFDANSGEINQSSINIIEEHLQGVPLFIIINKADTKSPSELDMLEKHIKNTVSKAGIDVQGYLRFSQKHDIKEIMNTVSKVSLNSYKEDYLREIYDKLDEEVIEAKTDYDNCKAQALKIQKEEISYKKRLDNTLREIEDLREEILEIPKQKQSFWGLGEDFFKMTKDEHSTFEEKIKDINSKMKNVIDVNKSIKKLSEDYQKNENEQQASKEQYNQLDKLKDEFTRLINAWDSKYLKRITR